MGKKRKIEKVGKKISFAEEQDDDLMYWANLPLKERMNEAAEWNKIVWVRPGRSCSSIRTAAYR